jgi:hypothetical protein
MKNKIFLLCALSLLSACGGAGTVTSAGISAAAKNDPSAELQSVDGTVVAFMDAYTEDENFRAVAYYTDDHIGTPPSSGQVTMDASYEVVGFTGISKSYSSGSYDYYQGYRFHRAGDLTIAFDFDDGSFYGTDGRLTLDGDLSGSNMTGTSSYYDVAGKVEGAVDANETVGAFYGRDETFVYAGAFTGAKN